jgi:metal-responsive CopG/Arc/MetJ family transcriptional regulator
MSSVKTAISVEGSLFQQAEEVAKEMHVSRSRLFAMAMEDFLGRRKTQDIIDQLNAVHSAPQTEEDRQFVEAAEAALAELTRDDKW